MSNSKKCLYLGLGVVMLCVLALILPQTSQAAVSYPYIHLDPVLGWVSTSATDCANLGGTMGDLNGDGSINSVDYQLLRQMIYGLGNVLLSPCADLDDNGYIDGSDQSELTTEIVVDLGLPLVSTSGKRPVIDLIGADPYILSAGATFWDPGATVTDDTDTGYPDPVQTIYGTYLFNDVNMAVGTYTVYYDAIDTSGNAAIQVVRTVNVFAPAVGGGGGYSDIIAPANTSVIINNGAESTDIADVTLTLHAEDASVPLQMMIANNSDFTGSDWIAYATSQAWTLSSGAGSKIIYAKFKDSYGNISAAVSDSINLTENGENGALEPQVLGEKYVDAGELQLAQIFDDAHYIWSGDINLLLGYMNANRDLALEQSMSSKYGAILGSNVQMALGGLETFNAVAITNFLTYGTKTTLKLGAGERAGVLNSYKAAYGQLPKTEEDWRDAIKIGNGRWPSRLSSEAESRAKNNFQIVYKRDANMANPNDNAAVTTMAYGLRPLPRNLDSEKAAITIFKKIFGSNPVTAIAWDTARAIAYSGATR
jgi:hypothetical protein